MGQDYSVIEIRLHPELYQLIQAEARRKRVTVNQLITHILARRLGRPDLSEPLGKNARRFRAASC